MTIKFSGKIWYWRGPAPFFFVTIAKSDSEIIHDISKEVTYGWGMIPVTVNVKDLTWKTALFPKDGCYILPVKAEIRKNLNLDEGDEMEGEMEV